MASSFAPPTVTHHSTRSGAATIAGDEPPQTPDLSGLTVLQVLPALGEQGGVERGTVDVAAAIVAAGGRAIVASAGGPRAETLPRTGAEHVTLPLASKNPFVMARNVGRLAEVIRREGVDIVHARSRAPAWSALYAARRTGAAFMTTFHGTYGGTTRLKHRYNGVMASGEKVIAISRFIADHLKTRYDVDDERIRVIPRGVDVVRFDRGAVAPHRIIDLARLWRLEDGAPVVLLPGRVTRWKGQAVFVEAIARLSRKDVMAIILGSDQGRVGYRMDLEALIDRRRLGGRVRLIEQTIDMPAAYMLSDVVVSASVEPEAFGRVAVEAQAVGRPVVATDHGGSRETVLPGVTGWLVPPEDPVALAEGIERALALDAAAREGLAAAAHAHVRAHFTREVMCARTLRVYDEVWRR